MKGKEKKPGMREGGSCLVGGSLATFFFPFPRNFIPSLNCQLVKLGKRENKSVFRYTDPAEGLEEMAAEVVPGGAG